MPFARLVLAAAIAAASQSTPESPARLSSHVFLIPSGRASSPNIGVVVGDRGTLVVDAGGSTAAESRALVRTVASLAHGGAIFLVSTGFEAGESGVPDGFPASVKIVRTRAQQQDIDDARSARPRAADVYFTRDYTLDLGGVEAQLVAAGPARTRGDIAVFVPGDRLLFAGGIVADHAFLSFSNPHARPPSWLAAIDRLEELRPLRVVPRRGAVGSTALLDDARMYIQAVQERVAELSPAFESVDALVAQVTKDLVEAYPRWSGRSEIGAAVTAAYAELRERD